MSEQISFAVRIASKQAGDDAISSMIAEKLYQLSHQAVGHVRLGTSIKVQFDQAWVNPWGDHRSGASSRLGTATAPEAGLHRPSATFSNGTCAGDAKARRAVSTAETQALPARPAGPR